MDKFDIRKLNIVHFWIDLVFDHQFSNLNILIFSEFRGISKFPAFSDPLKNWPFICECHADCTVADGKHSWREESLQVYSHTFLSLQKLGSLRRSSQAQMSFSDPKRLHRRFSAGLRPLISRSRLAKKSLKMMRFASMSMFQLWRRKVYRNLGPRAFCIYTELRWTSLQLPIRF